MSLTPFNKIHQFYPSCNHVQILSAMVLPKEPPNTYLRRRNVAHPISRFTSSKKISPALSQHISKSVSNEHEKVGSQFQSKAPIKLIDWFSNTTKNTVEKFDTLLGLTEIRNALRSLNVAQTSFLKAKERRETKQNLVDELSLKLRKPKPPKLVLNETVISMEELTNAVKCEFSVNIHEFTYPPLILKYSVSK